MSESTGGHKRQRTDSPDGPSAIANSPRKRDEEFWFEDGSIVLISRDVEFRVFKGRLATHSPVFRDMFSLPAPAAPPHLALAAAAAETPVVHLSDSPEDIRHILRVCMPNSSLSFTPFSTQKPSFDMTSAVIRMAHKYQIHDMVAQAVQYLKQYYPANFEQWTRVFGSSARLQGSNPFKDVHVIGVVNLAHLVDEPSLLPAALLSCCTLGPALVQGLTREDGSHESLSLEDIGRCLGGHAQLGERTLVLAARIFDPTTAVLCASPQRCKDALLRMLTDVQYEADIHARCPGLFYSWIEPHEDTQFLKCCERCKEMVRTRDLDERTELWDDLPAIMGVMVGNWGLEVP